MGNIQTKEKINLAVLISGRGSNLKAICDAIVTGYLDRIELKVVIANQLASGEEHARSFGCSYHIVPRTSSDNKTTKELHDKKILAILEKYGIDLVILAGYNQILQHDFVARYEGRLMNIHPSLLPSFEGTLHAQRDALDYGVKMSGCTVHFVTDGIDTGPIILQAAVPIKDNDTIEMLSDRILELEHIIYPKAIKLFSEGRLKIVGRKVFIESEMNVTLIDKPERYLDRMGISEDIRRVLFKKFSEYSMLVENITPREAMILKQEMLALGGDCAVPKECILNNLMPIDIILIGNPIQLQLLVKKLKYQAFDLPELAKKLDAL